MAKNKEFWGKKCGYCGHKWQQHRHIVNNDTWAPCTLAGCDCFTFKIEDEDGENIRKRLTIIE